MVFKKKYTSRVKPIRHKSDIDYLSVFSLQNTTANLVRPHGVNRQESLVVAIELSLKLQTPGKLS